MNLLEAFAGELLSGLANTGLSLDPDTRAQLDSLEGAALRLELTLPPQAIVIRVTDGALRIQPGSAYPAQTIVRGSAQDLLALLRTGSASTGLSIDGDPALLSRFEALFRNYRPEFDGLVPDRFLPGAADGNSPLEQWLGLVEEGLDSARRATTGLLRQGEAGLREAIDNAFVDRSEFAVLEREADELRLAIDRLQARLKQRPKRADPAS